MQTHLVLTRKELQRIKIDGPCEVRVEKIAGGYVRLGIFAERSVRVIRNELEGDKPREAA